MSVFSAYPLYQPLSGFSELSNFASLINDLAQPTSSRQGHCQARRAHTPRRQAPSFTPRFDVRETEQNYELHGELPGVAKENIHIDFTDPQTIVIRGNVERTYTAGTPPAAALLADKPATEKPDEEMSGAIAHEHAPEEDAVLVDADEETGSNKSFQPTVEDDNEGEDDTRSTTSGTAQPTPATTVAETAKPETAVASAPEQKTETAAPKPVAKYWVYERSTGSFSRSFTFSTRVDHENVSASLNNGILSVVVPKAKKHESHRIAIF